jgi:hypothetical protein
MNFVAIGRYLVNLEEVEVIQTSIADEGFAKEFVGVLWLQSGKQIALGPEDLKKLVSLVSTQRENQNGESS